MAEYPLSDAQIMQLAYKVRGLIRAESRAIPEVPIVGSLDGIASMPVVQTIGGVSKYVRAPLDLLAGPPGAAPTLVFVINALPYGSEPTASVSGAAERPTITIGFPLAKNGDNTIMKKGADGIYSKLESAPESDWQLLFTFDEVMPDVSDFSPEGIAILQQPATEAAEEIREQSEAIAVEEERRVTAEGQRDTAETARATAEDERATAETARATAETSRTDAESSRAIAESGRATAEENRITEEMARASAEGERATAETARIAAENQREEAVTGRLESADNAIGRLNTLSDHRDKIVAGYWWRWNEATGEYENTGYNAGLSILAYFDTEALLRAGVSNPNPGDAYGVGLAAPYDIFIYDGTAGDWVNNGQLQGADGADGKSAYRIWLDEGNTGTEADFLASLKGRTGDDGLSAYKLAVAGGFSGTVDEWLASLNGDDGLSAYELAVSEGFSGAIDEWLSSLKGDPGRKGDPGFVIHKTVTLAVESWAQDAQSGLWARRIVDGDIMDGAQIYFAPTRTSNSAYIAAKVYADADAEVGSFTIYAHNQPADEMEIKYSIITTITT